MIDLRLGDCLEIMKTIPDKSIDLVLTDPPFNVSLDYKSIDDCLEDEDYYLWCKKWLIECFRVLKERHYGIIFTGDKKSFYMFKGIMDSGLSFHHFLKWHKPTCQRGLSGSVLFCRTELAFLTSKGIPDTSLINRKKFYQDTIILKNTTPNQKGRGVDHNARRPESLYRFIIEGFTQEGDTILDCFMGSGSCGMGAKEIRRKFIGIEINPDYYKLSERRINQTMENLL